MKNRWWLLLCCFPMLAQAAGELSVTDARIRETLPGQTVSSGYLVVHNAGASDAVLSAVQCDCSPHVEMHQHVHENGMMMMRAVPSVTVPAGGEVVFEPGGYHLMLMDLPAPLTAGRVAHLELHFADGNSVSVSAPIQTLQQTLDSDPQLGHH